MRADSAAGDGDPGLPRVQADRNALERELGRGGIAAVYLAHDRTHGRRVSRMIVHDGQRSAKGRPDFAGRPSSDAPERR